MTGPTGPWVEAESVPRGEIATYFVPPPDLLTPWFPRSAVVSGSLGAGKTMLLRYLAETEPDFVIEINLLEELSCVADPAVPLTANSAGTATYAQLAEAKAVALVAITMAQKLQPVLGAVPETLDACVPRDVALRLRSGADPRQLRRALAEASLDEFGGIPTRSHPLRQLATEAAELLASRGQRLLLLFDRAELVRPRLLTPVMQLLEKSPGYRAIVAMRPGALDISYIEAGGRFAAGDDYDTVHLGQAPRSDRWRTFTDQVFQRQMPDVLSDIPPGARDLVHTVSRESLRYAIRLCSVYLGADGDEASKERTLARAIELLRVKHIQSLIGNMRGYHPNFSGFLSGVRKDFVKLGSGAITGPAVLQILSASSSTGRRPELDRFARFIEHALRHSGLLVPDGNDWQPYTQVAAVEVPPLCLWRGSDPWWNSDSANPMELVMNDHAFFKTGYGAADTPTRVFLALEFDRETSEAFRSTLEDLFVASANEGALELVTGENIVGGTRWGEDIAKRIKESRIVVGDISGRSREVFFEVGYAYGLGKSFLFVVKDKSDIDACPAWVRTSQIHHYCGSHGLERIMQSLRSMRSKRSSARWPPVPRAEPDRICWLGSFDWLSTSLKQVQSIAVERQLSMEVFDYDHAPETPGEVDEVLSAIASAGLVVVPFDGTERDYFSNMLVGLVCAKRLGAGRTPRRALVVSLGDQALDGGWVSTSAVQAKSVRRVRTADVARRVRDYTKSLEQPDRKAKGVAR